MRRAAILIVFLGAALFLPRTTLAEHLPAQIRITVSCDCTDSTGKAYGAAIKALLENDPDFQKPSPDTVSTDDATIIRINSRALPAQSGLPRVALTVLYTHGGKSMQQTIQTCAHNSLQLSAAMLVRDVKQLEAETDEHVASDTDATAPTLIASAR